jgi:hypothetical protein
VLYNFNALHRRREQIGSICSTWRTLCKLSGTSYKNFQNHLVVGLLTTDRDFPMHLWDRLLPQAVITLNLLCTSQISPNLSAYAQIFGQYNFSSNTLAPPGTHCLLHKKPTHQASWTPHTVDAWYVGPATTA